MQRLMMLLPMLVLLALLAPAGSLAAQGRGAVRDSDAVVALEYEWLAASDSATLDRLLAPDFRHPVPTGQIITKSEHIAWAVAHPRPADRVARFARLEIRVYGDVAIADGSVVTTDRAGHEVARSVFSDVFVRRSGQWQAVNAQENAVAPATPR